MRAFIITIAISFFAGALIVGAINGCGKNKVKQVTQIVNASNDSLKYYHDLWATEHATRLVVQGDRDVIKALYGGKYDSVCKRLSLRSRQLKEMSEMLLLAQGKVIARVDTFYKHDPTKFIPKGKVRHYSWKDQFMQVEIYADTVRADVDYKIMVPVTLSSYWKRKWFLGKKRYYVDGYSENPSVKIIGITSLKIN